MNKGSVLGQHGTYAKEAAFELLANKAYSFVGSDAHNLRRDSGMYETYQIVRRFRGSDYTEKIFEYYPSKMLNGMDIRKKVPDEE